MKKRRAVRAWLALVVLGGLCACQGGDPGPRGTGDEGDAAPPDGAAGVDAIPAPPAMPFVTDAQGRVLILHGANVVGGAKSSPYYPQVTREQILRLSADWGFNFARVLILWAGVEPAAGTIDEVFLDRVEERLDWFHEAGILVLLDMHQDVYSEFTCGDGAPLWAVRTDDLPIRCPAQWFLGYFEPGVQRAFDNFWDATGPHADLQERYVAMWVAVAERFRDHPAVMGYDLMNEPHPGTAFDIPEALGMGAREDSPSPAFDRERLQPFYQRLIDAIRTVDSDRWIAFEPRYGAPGNGEPAFFTEL
ncbi:MAG: cellulase family glycosylhydrolase, partial [Deltaproteobacteria bacterium]|nr:cellulase family glycosylhydrolase [Deltaproteobacteria bacterium]